MTVQDFLDVSELMVPGGPCTAVTLRWLSELEGRVRVELLGHDPAVVIPITEGTPRDTVLSVPHPYDRLYWMHHMAMTDYVAGDSVRYENAAALFNEAYAGYGRYLKRRGN